MPWELLGSMLRVLYPKGLMLRLSPWRFNSGAYSISTDRFYECLKQYFSN